CRLDAVVEPPVRLIKLDVEGAEWAALRGCTKLIDHDPSPHLIVELKVATAEPFGYHPLELVDDLLARRPYALEVLRTQRRR
ncbi:FkbM family methyltransferase, partial [Streptococcus pyogenes]|uniref:FkbM family methyltransferase n=1 Tax=Streptococcus pyogenes TaxID=1314 RepID=UPI003DA13DAF